MDTNLLERVGTRVIPARDVPFVAKEKFVVNTDPNAAVKIVCIHPNFREWFLEGDGKTEGACGEQVLRDDMLREQLRCAAIIAALGGEERSETTLYATFSLMEEGGAEGVKGGFFNVFVKDSAGVLRAVRVFLYGGGWNVYADFVKGPRWDAGNRVFSPNN